MWFIEGAYLKKNLNCTKSSGNDITTRQVNSMEAISLIVVYFSCEIGVAKSFFSAMTHPSPLEGEKLYFDEPGTHRVF